MAKRSTERTPEQGHRIPPLVRIQKQTKPVQTNASIKELLSATGRFHPPGHVAIYSGTARSQESLLHGDLPLPGWGWRRWTIDAPPPGGQVLWLQLELASQWWQFRSFPGATNNSSHYKYADFGVKWRWMLLPDQFEVPGAPANMADSNKYEFYASKAPGGNNWTAWWVHPARGVTLTPEGKESDPNALALLLRTERNGRLGLMYASQFPSEGITFNGHEAAGYVLDGGPRADSLYFSMAVALPRAVVPVEGIDVVGTKSRHRPKASRRLRRGK